MRSSDVTVERLSAFSDADAAGIGRLMPHLHESFSGAPMDTALLQAIIDSPYHEQLVARLSDGTIIGAATLNILMGPGVNKEGYLEDFVVDPKLRGQGIGDEIWQEMLAWCRERAVDLGFTSNPSRVSAQRFYQKHGAQIRKTTVFHVSVE